MELKGFEKKQFVYLQNGKIVLIEYQGINGYFF